MLLILVGRAIWRFFTGQPTKRTHPTGLLVLGGLLAVATLVLLVPDHAGPTCAGMAMHPGQACRYTNGSTKTYDEQLHAEHRSDLWYGLIGGGAASGLILLGLYRRQQLHAARALLAQAHFEAVATGRRPPPLAGRAPSVVPPRPVYAPSEPTMDAGSWAIEDLFPPLPPDPTDQGPTWS